MAATPAMLPILSSLEKLTIGAGRPNSADPYSKSWVSNQLRSSQILYAAYDHDEEKVIQNGIVKGAMEMRAVSQDFADKMMQATGENTLLIGRYNQGAIVRSLPEWFNRKLYGMFARDFKPIGDRCRKDGLFYRRTLAKSDVMVAELTTEAHMMLTAARHGFGPSIYAIYLAANTKGNLQNGEAAHFISLNAVMDNGYPDMNTYLRFYDDAIDVDEFVDEFVEELSHKCMLASQAGFLMLDMKPSNILCGTKADGRLNIMFIDFDPRFTFENSPDDASCILYINLFLLIMHLQCYHNWYKGSDNIYELGKRLIVKLEKAQTAAHSSTLCRMMENIQLESRETSDGRRKPGYDVYIPGYAEDMSFDRQVLTFVSMVEQYFDKEGKGSRKCAFPFEMTIDDETPLTEQLLEWWRRQHYPTKEDLRYWPQLRKPWMTNNS